MRSAGGVCTVQQTLTTEAASVLKHSLTLARRRGHAQVTPLHVAATLLLTSPRSSLLRRACLNSHHQSSSSSHHHHHHHPLHCRALELCFNVALNRLPTTPSPLLHGQPSLSNALIAALKRAQAHQRRGSIEQNQNQNQQHPPVLAVKVEIEQLILSILDDPSVSRVMREAGFSSTAVKNNLEDSSSSSSSPSPSVFQCYNTSGRGGGVYSSPSSPSRTDSTSSFWHTHFLNYTPSQQNPNPIFFSPPKRPSDSMAMAVSVKDDIKLILNVMSRKNSKRRNIVVVGDSVSVTQGIVSELMSMVERKEVPEELSPTHFIKFQVPSPSSSSPSVPLGFMKREEVEKNISELKREVGSVMAASPGGRVIVYAGDLKWTVEKTTGGGGGGCTDYSPVDHMVAEMGRLVSDQYDSCSKVWLMATANYQTYMRCQMRDPPLELQWGLQAVSVPSSGLGFTLHVSSVNDSRISFAHNNPSQTVLETKLLINGKEEEQNGVISCCEECSSNYEKEAEMFKSSMKPSSLLHLSSSNNNNHKDPDHKVSSPLPYWLQPHSSSAANHKDDLAELRRKWTRLCQSLHQGRHNKSHLDSSLFNHQALIGKTYSHCPPTPWWANPSSVISPDPTSISFAESALKPGLITSSQPRFRRQNSCHIEFTFSPDSKHKTQQQPPREPNLDSLKNSQDKEVKITLALGNSQFPNPENLAEHGRICRLLQDNLPWQFESIPSIADALIDCREKVNWFLIEGDDSIGKRRLGIAIAESIFGSTELFFHMKMRNKCNRAKNHSSEMVKDALRNHEKLVILVEDFDFADAQFVKFLADGYTAEKFGESDRKGQIVLILAKGDPPSHENRDPVIQMKLEVGDTVQNSEIGQFDHKRKSEWELTNKAKSPRINECEEIMKKQFTRQPSSNTLDLNIMANDEDDEELGEPSPVTSDLTGENPTEQHNPLRFLEHIKNRFSFNSNSGRDSQLRDMFMSKIRGCFEEVFGGENTHSFAVEEKVLDSVLFGCGDFLNGLFEKWLKDVFQTSLKTVKFGGKESMRIRVCLGGGDKGWESGLEDRFMGSSLPKQIKVSLV